MKKQDIGAEWRFLRRDEPRAALVAFDDADWESVCIPHTWNADDMRPGAPTEESYIGPAWYRKRFRLPSLPQADERAFILFEAVANHSEVWVDGNFVGGRDGGFLSFRLDITEALAPRAEHVIAVRANNASRQASVPPDPIDWERFGGIYRPVWLVRTGGAQFEIKGIRIRTPQVNAAEAAVLVTASVRECAVRARTLRLVHRLLDPDGACVERMEAPVVTSRGRSVRSEIVFPPIRHPALWSPDSPAVYRVESALLDGERELDRDSNPLGFRWFAFDADRGFSLNGRPLKLQGVCAHQEFIGLGNACPRRVHRRDLEQMKEAGINFLRTSHYPRDEYTLDLCDRLGIMVMEEQPFWHGSLRTAHGEALVANARRLMREMVEHHANHPSIIAWNTVNEIMLTPVKGEPHPDPKVRAARHQLQRDEWPFALRAIEAMNDELHRADPDRPTSVVVGAGWARNDEAGITRLADIVAYNGGAIHDLNSGEPVYDLCRRRDPGRVSMMSEGVLNEIAFSRDDWENQSRAWEQYAAHWSRFYEREWFCGGSMWVFADYSAKGTYRTRGLVDGTRLPYESFYFFKSLWNPALSAHICGHWDGPLQTGSERRVVVFSNADRAELFVNGESRGRREPDFGRWPHLPHPPLEWKVAYEPGELRVVAGRNGETVTDRRVTAGPPARLAIANEQDTLRADGRDVAFFTLRVEDRQGHRCHTAAVNMEIAVEGPARLAGPAVIEALGGLARFAVRSTGEEARVTVRAHATGLSPASSSLPASHKAGARWDEGGNGGRPWKRGGA
jgi:beta-galactosidase